MNNIILGVVRAEVTVDGQTTIANVRALTREEQVQGGFRPVGREFLEGVSGAGIARCRKEDHFEYDIGLNLALTRAMADFGHAAADRVATFVETQRDHAVRLAGERVARALQEQQDAVNALAEAAGLSGRVQDVEEVTDPALG